MPRDLNSVRSSASPRRSFDPTSDASDWTRAHRGSSDWPKASISSRESRCAVGTVSTTTRAQRSNTPRATSAAAGTMAPTAFTCAPRASMAGSRNGSRALVTSVTIGAPPTVSATLDMLSARRPRSFSIRCTKAVRRASLRPNTRTRRSFRTAATAATWVMACLPVPTMASSSASGVASRSVATPDAAPVRYCPIAKASMMARRAPVALSNKISSGMAPPGVCDHVFVPTMPRPAKAAPMAWRVACPAATSHSTCVLVMLTAPPRASTSRPASSARMAPAMSIIATTSASVIQSGSLDM